jgi:hypothetical protein
MERLEPAGGACEISNLLNFIAHLPPGIPLTPPFGTGIAGENSSYASPRNQLSVFVVNHLSDHSGQCRAGPAAGDLSPFTRRHNIASVSSKPRLRDR